MQRPREKLSGFGNARARHDRAWIDDEVDASVRAPLVPTRAPARRARSASRVPSSAGPDSDLEDDLGLARRGSPRWSPAPTRASRRRTHRPRPPPPACRAGSRCRRWRRCRGARRFLGRRRAGLRPGPRWRRAARIAASWASIFVMMAVASATCPTRVADLRDRSRHVAQPGVAVGVNRDAGAGELLLQVLLAAVRRPRDPAAATGSARDPDRAARRPAAACFTSGGYSSKLLTAMTCGPAPIAKRISVTAGISEMIRCGRGWRRHAHRDDHERDSQGEEADSPESVAHHLLLRSCRCARFRASTATS